MPDLTQFPDGNYMCEDCEELFNPDEFPPIGSISSIGGDIWGLCPTCAKTRNDGLIRTAARLKKSEFCYGGYAMAYYPPDSGIVLCFACALSGLENDSEPLHAECEDGDQQYYGGIYCDGCNAEIVAPCCPECGDELGDKLRLYCDDADARELCFDCAVKLVQRYCRALHNDGTEHPSDIHGSQAARLPGVGIEILATKVPQYRWDDGSPWYARAGMIYRYAGALERSYREWNAAHATE